MLRWLEFDVGLGVHFPMDTSTVSILGWEKGQPALERWNVTPLSPPPLGGLRKSAKDRRTEWDSSTTRWPDRGRTAWPSWICRVASVLPLARILARRGALLPAGRPVQRRPRGDAAAAGPRRAGGAPAGGPDGEPWRWERWAASGRARYQGGTLAGVTHQARLPARPRGDHALAQPGVQAARAPGHLPRLRHPGLPRGRPALRHPPTWSTWSGGARPGHAGHPGHHLQPLRRQLDLPARHACGERSRATRAVPLRRLAGDQGEPISGHQTGDEDGVWPAELQDPDALHPRRVRQPGRRRDSTTRRRAQALRLRGPARLRHERPGPAQRPGAAATSTGSRSPTATGSGSTRSSTSRSRRRATSAERSASSPRTWASANFFLVGEMAGGDYDRSRYLDVLRAQPERRAGHRRGAAHAARRSPRGWPPGATSPASTRVARCWARTATSATGTSRCSTTTTTSSAEAALRRRAARTTRWRPARAPAVHAGHPLHLRRHRAGLARPEAAERQLAARLGRAPTATCARRCSGREHPRPGRACRAAAGRRRDPDLPGFGPFGTAGQHCFDPQPPGLPADRRARGACAQLPGPALTAASTCGRSRCSADRSPCRRPARWSPGRGSSTTRRRCASLNPHGTAARGGGVVVDASSIGRSRR